MDITDQTYIDRAGEVILQTYARLPVTFVSGQGCWLTDNLGREYLDCLGGIAVTVVGHANQRVVAAVSEQIDTLAHVSNLYYTTPMIELAEKLTELSGLDRVFFANDGATSNEAAIKLARRWGQQRRGGECFQIVSLDRSFHGRTLATLATTGQPEKQATFAPLPSGFVQVPPQDLDAMSAAIGEQTAAVMVETIQAEGGVYPLGRQYLEALAALCAEREVLLIVDDIQVGMGRTGSWYSWQGMDIQPDIVTMAKGLANGLPIGVCLSREEVAAAFEPGDHATTFGGGPVVCAAALAVLAEIEESDLLTNCRQRSEQLRKGLERIEGVKEVRGEGLLLAAVLEDLRAMPVVMLCHMEHGLIVNAVSPDAVRFAPPLNITKDEIDQCLERFAAAIFQAYQEAESQDMEM